MNSDVISRARYTNKVSIGTEIKAGIEMNEI